MSGTDDRSGVGADGTAAGADGDRTGAEPGGTPGAGADAADHVGGADAAPT
ncbi:hypothetical protein GA0115261_101785, partial [Streptomyces sp. OspMP-M43]